MGEASKNSLQPTLVTASVMLPVESRERPPVILVHGAANSAGVWRFWQRELAAHGWPTYAINLRGHGESPGIDVSHTSMNDYAGDVCALASQFSQLPILIGWSMGGLVAMMVAAAGRASACVALAPSIPARHIDPSVQLRTGEFTSAEYGITSTDPEDQPAMPDLDREERMIALASLCRESRLARDERRRGIVIEELSCPLLVVTGTKDQMWPSERYYSLWLVHDRLSMEGASHWGLVLNRRALAHAIPAVIRWIKSYYQELN